MKLKYHQIALTFILSVRCLISVAQVQFASLGDYTLENNQVILNCKIGYQTFGELNADRSNAILFPTWYGGTSESLLSYIGPDQMLDSTQYFIIVVDAFGDGISSSPSNSRQHAGQSFPVFSIRDMVNAQYKLLTEHFNLEHLYAVTGISMGGMQTFQWMASYPDFFDRAIPIVGSPKLTSQDMLLFELMQRIMKPCTEKDCPDLTVAALLLEFVTGFTPQYRISETSPEAFPEFLASIKQIAEGFHSSDLLSQMQAIAQHDITGGTSSLKEVAQKFQGDAFVVIATQDHMLMPATSINMVNLLNAPLLELDSDCGHYSFSCEQEKISQAVRNFLHETQL